ncbi:MAG: NDP-sugar synthase [Actinomycetota bacterium]
MKSVVLAGGLGSRLRPLTNHTPKSLLPFCNRPFLLHLLESLARGGVDEVLLSGGLDPAPVARFAERGDLPFPASAFGEEEALGTAGPIRVVADHLTETFVVANGDILSGVDIAELIAFHRERGSICTIALTPVDDPSAFGLVPIEEVGRVRAFLEKPSSPDEVPPDAGNLINAGVYVLEPEVIDFIHGNGACSIEREVFPALVDADLPVYGYSAPFYWSEIGTPGRYLDAHRDALRGLVEVSQAGDEIAPGVRAGAGVKVEAGAHLMGPCLIGENVVIGMGARIGPDVVLGNGVRVGAHAEIDESVVHGGCELGVGVRMSRAICGERVRLGRKSVVSGEAVVGPDVDAGDENEFLAAIRVAGPNRLPNRAVRFSP